MDLSNSYFIQHSVFSECAGADKVVNGFSLAGKSAGFIQQHAIKFANAV